ncbi:MAG: hypothetical protein WC353_06255 [Candidatus Peribacter sp.]|jgi:hypothetical protein
MSTDGEPSFDSLPDHLKTSKLAYAIDPEGAADAADNLQERLFWGRVVFHNFSQAELSVYLWRKWGEQLRGWSDAEVLAWLKAMDFRDHSTFDGMGDQDVIQLIRKNDAVLASYAERYADSGDFAVVCRQAGMEPSDNIEKRRVQARRFLCEDPLLKSLLSELLAH